MTIKPNFFLIGAPKCGTTAIAASLANHPEIFICAPKEPQYFLYERNNPYGFNLHSNISDRGSYLALFESAGQAKVVGEASTLYIHAAHVANAIADFAPRAKIMAVLRNPVERAYSQYLYWHQFERYGRTVIVHVPACSGRPLRVKRIAVSGSMARRLAVSRTERMSA